MKQLRMSSQVLQAAHKDIHNTYTSAHASITGYGCKPLEGTGKENENAARRVHLPAATYKSCTYFFFISLLPLLQSLLQLQEDDSVTQHCPKMAQHSPLLHISNTANSEKNCMHHSKYSNGRTYVCTYAGSSKEPCTYVCLLIRRLTN